MKEFGKIFSYLSIKELIEYYAVFDGYGRLDLLKGQETLLENIEENILKRYDKLYISFIFDKDQEDIEKLLYRIAVGNRKIYSIYKDDISYFHGTSLYKTLFVDGIISKEHSREKPIKKEPYMRLKKELRRYQVEDKIKFSKGFYRFWFTFIAPNSDLIQKGEYKEVLEVIKKGLDKYVSFAFEELSNRLISKEFGVQSMSYWDRSIELDLLAKTNDEKIVVGECKWKNQKVSKNVLNKLKKKSKLSGLNVDFFALFSKNGFSNELLKSRDDTLLLYDLDSFKVLFNAR